MGPAPGPEGPPRSELGNVTRKYGDVGRPDAVVIVRVPECIKGQKATTLRQLQNEGNQVWKDAVQGQTKGLLKRFRAIFETRYVIWIHNPAVTGPSGAGQ